MPLDHTVRRPDGYIRAEGPHGRQEVDTVQCVHCGFVWEFMPGSGRQRGFCMKCKGMTCGAKECMECIPLEARIEHIEGTKTKYDGLILDIFGKPMNGD